MQLWCVLGLARRLCLADHGASQELCWRAFAWFLASVASPCMHLADMRAGVAKIIQLSVETHSGRLWHDFAHVADGVLCDCFVALFFRLARRMPI